MVICKKIIVVITIFIYIATGVILKILFSFSNPYFRLRIISHWTKKFTGFLTIIFGLKIVIEGDRSLLEENGNFVISNHLGYLDGVILGSLFPVVYISKDQVKSWPVFGWMTDVAGTIFIDRENKSKAAEYIQETTKILKHGVNVLLFPEGTSTNGERLLPFQSIHFQSALNAKCKVVPITITYTRIDDESVNSDNRDKIFWYGQVKFHQHLFKLLELGNIEAKVVINPIIDLAIASNKGYSRKDLSKLLHKVIVQNYPLFDRAKKSHHFSIQNS